MDLLDVGVEAEARAGALGLLAQQVRELAAVADLVVLRIDAGVERRRRVQPGLDRAAAAASRTAGATPSSASARTPASARASSRGAAQQDEEALGALVVEVQPRAPAAAAARG